MEGSGLWWRKLRDNNGKGTGHRAWLGRSSCCPIHGPNSHTHDTSADDKGDFLNLHLTTLLHVAIDVTGLRLPTARVLFLIGQSQIGRNIVEPFPSHFLQRLSSVDVSSKHQVTGLDVLVSYGESGNSPAPS